MRFGIVTTVLRREWAETVRNRLLMSTILIPPMVLTIAPLVLAGVVGDRALPPQLAQSVISQRPEWATFTAAELAGAFAVQQFLAFFLLMPAYIPLSIATFSIIGEKQARTLEPVLATPIRTAELLTGKAVAALVPGRPRRLGDLHRVRGPGLDRLRAGAVRRRHRRELAGRRLRARAGGRAVVGRRRGHRELARRTTRASPSRSAASSSCRSSR